MVCPWLIALIGGCVIVLWLLIEDWRMIHKKRARFAGREPIEMAQLQNVFPQSHLTLDEFTEFLSCVERATDIPKEYLRPGDRFDEQLAPVRGWEFDDGLVLLPEVLHCRFGGATEAYDLAAESQTLAGLLLVVQEASQSQGERTINSRKRGNRTI